MKSSRFLLCVSMNIKKHQQWIDNSSIWWWAGFTSGTLVRIWSSSADEKPKCTSLRALLSRKHLRRKMDLSNLMTWRHCWSKTILALPVAKMGKSSFVLLDKWNDYATHKHKTNERESPARRISFISTRRDGWWVWVTTVSTTSLSGQFWQGSHTPQKWFLWNHTRQDQCSRKKLWDWTHTLFCGVRIHLELRVQRWGRVRRVADQ